MRLSAPLLGACLLLVAHASSAAPPVDSRAPGRGVARAGRLHAEARALGLDRASPLRTSGIGGHYRAVVILLQFPDWRADTLGHAPAAYDSILFSTGAVPTGSVRDYYAEVSRGALDLDGVVTRWYTAPHNYAYYTNNQYGFGVWPNNAQQMAADAIALADADVDFSQFDNDGPDGIPDSGDDDGLVDGIFVVHAGPGAEETGLGSDINSHKWNLRLPYAVDGVTAYDYTTEPEEWAGQTAGTAPGDLISIGVFCHEYGHVLGLPDLYDTNPDPTMSEGIGEWDLMGTGVYTHAAGNAPGSTPAHPSAWSKLRLGWAEETWVTQDSLGVILPPVETSGRVFRLWTNGIDAGEYFLLENRQPVGFDSALVRSSIEQGYGPAHGLLVYHVDDSVYGNDSPDHKMLDLEEAGGEESFSWPGIGVQNLDIESGILAAQTDCGLTPNVRGNRGDRFDPRPGPLGVSSFEFGSCPGSESYCGITTQVAVRNVAEVGTDIHADLYVRGVTVRRQAVVIDDSPALYPGVNDGDGRAETGERIGLFFPLRNLDPLPTDPLHAKVGARDLFTGLLGDSIDYGAVAGSAADSGSALLADVNLAPDPRGALYAISVYSPNGLVAQDSVEILVGTKTGLCETFESTDRLWLNEPGRCGSPAEWHRESGVNHTPGGAWAWRLGPVGQVGSYAAAEDARLVSQPVLLAGGADTLVFWQRYDTEPNFDGLSVEVSLDAGASWALLQPLGGYPSGDRWTGFQSTFKEVKLPLAGLSGTVQFAFRFRSQPPNGGLGWWIDDVRVAGTAECTTTAVAISLFDAAPDPSGRGILLSWRVADGAGSRVAIDRAPAAGGERARIAVVAGDADGSYADGAVTPGAAYDYWLTASREGEPDAVRGPVRAVAPAGAPPPPLALSAVRPNPFNPEATVGVTLDRPGRFILRVYRADGSAVRTLADGNGEPGAYRFVWNGTDDRGAGVGSGIYFFELRSGQRTRVQKAILLR